jgi:hypothetical protein
MKTVYAVAFGVGTFFAMSLGPGDGKSAEHRRVSSEEVTGRVAAHGLPLLDRVVRIASP